MTYTHVLITRPQPEAGRLAERIRSTALAPVVMPAYGFRASRPGPEWRAFCAASGRKLVVFTSKRAVEFGLEPLRDGWPHGTEVAAIGPATSALLEQSGVNVSLDPGGGFTSEQFLAQPDLERRPGHALIVAAPGGRTALAEGLASKGWSVEIAHVYVREDLPLDRRETERLLAAERLISVWTSENAMQSLRDRLPAAAWAIVCRGTGVVISERLKAALEDLGVLNVVVAGGPGNEALFECVSQLT